METREYNGWTNYETWNLALWLNNDEGSYRHWGSRTEDAIAEAQDDDETDEKNMAAAAELLAGWLEQETNEGAPEASGFYGDVLRAALQEVNYREIAERWIVDAE